MRSCDAYYASMSPQVDSIWFEASDSDRAVNKQSIAMDVSRLIGPSLRNLAR